MRTSNLLLICFLAAIICMAGCKENTINPILPGSISGRVLSAMGNVPLEGVLITTNPATSAILSDVDGSFSIEDVPEGTYVVSAENDGYARETVSIAVRGGKTTNAVILVAEDSKQANISAPTIVAPPENQIQEPASVTLVWSRSAGYLSDTLKYTVKLYEGTAPEAVFEATGLTDTTCQVTDLKYGLTYFWQVTVNTENAETVNGNVWKFTTRSIPDNRYLYVGFVDVGTDIFSSDSTKAGTIRLTNTASRELWPRWNKWRNKIAFISDREGAYHIYSMRADGSEQQRLSTLPVAGYHNTGMGFCWSPDGVWLFYAHYDQLYRIDQFGGNQMLIATAPDGRHFREVEWSLQYDRLVVHTVGNKPFDSEIQLLTPNGSQLTELVGNAPGSLGAPSFSIDGRSVLYTQDLSGYEADDGRQLDSHIMRISLDQKDTLDLSFNKNNGTNDLYPRYSPDGAWIIFVNTPNDDSGPGNVMIMKQDGTERRPLFLNAQAADWK